MLHQGAVVAGHRAAVAEAAEVLGGVEAPRRELAEAAHPLPLPLRAVRLRGVLEQPEAALPADGRAARRRRTAGRRDGRR